MMRQLLFGLQVAAINLWNFVGRGPTKDPKPSILGSTLLGLTISNHSSRQHAKTAVMPRGRSAMPKEPRPHAKRMFRV